MKPASASSRRRRSTCRSPARRSGRPGSAAHPDGSQRRQRVRRAGLPRRRRAAVRVLASSIATVSGPTPPGTGVIAAAFGATAGKSTSPTRTEPFSVERRHPLRVVADQAARRARGRLTRLMPTSITTAPGAHVLGGDQAGAADRGDQEVGLAADRRRGRASSSARPSPCSARAGAGRPSACRRSCCGRPPRRAGRRAGSP